VTSFDLTRDSRESYAKTRVGGSQRRPVEEKPLRDTRVGDKEDVQ
jgi:hypothetical protein